MAKKKITLVKYAVTFYDNGVPKFEAGRAYPVTEETERHVVLGYAEKFEGTEAELALNAAELAADEAAEKALATTDQAIAEQDAAAEAEAEAERQRQLAAGNG